MQDSEIGLFPEHHFTGYSGRLVLRLTRQLTTAVAALQYAADEYGCAVAKQALKEIAHDQIQFPQ